MVKSKNASFFYLAGEDQWLNISKDKGKVFCSPIYIHLFVYYAFPSQGGWVKQVSFVKVTLSSSPYLQTHNRVLELVNSNLQYTLTTLQSSTFL